MRNQFKQVPHKNLAKAVKLIGGQSETARQLSKLAKVEIDQTAIHAWVNRQGMCPPEYALAIKKLTGGKVTAHQLCPDVYPKGMA